MYAVLKCSYVYILLNRDAMHIRTHIIIIIIVNKVLLALSLLYVIRFWKTDHFVI